MDRGFTYGSPTGIRASLYLAPEFDAPDEITVTRNGEPVRFLRVSDHSLECRKVDSRITAQGEVAPVPGECRNPDCHRMMLGACQCGRHQAPVRFARAT
jgi:hypothetical protein